MIALALGCLGVLGYTYVGYPALLGLAARWRPHGLSPDPSWEPTVTVCIAAHDVAAVLDAKLASVVAQTYPAHKLAVLVYSDGSTDDTAAVVRRWVDRAAERGIEIRVLEGRVRCGKPTALNRMHAEARGEVMFITDARQTLVPGALRALVSRLGNPLVGCVTGNLVLRGASGAGVYWRYESWIRRKESTFRSVVGMTGPIAALRREDFVPVPEDLILDDMWIPMQLRLRGRRVLLCEDAVAYDEAFGDERELGRKVRTLAGNYQVFARMPALLSPFANPAWFETVSHKVMRLLCPWALIGLAVSTLAGLGAATPGRPWLTALGVAQGAFYGAAACGEGAGRLGRVARTFVVLNAAALIGLWRFVTGRQKITW